MTQQAIDQTVLEDISAATAALGALFLLDPASEEGEKALDSMRAVAESPATWPFAKHSEAAAAFSAIAGMPSDAGKLSKRYRKLFVGPNRLAAPPWGSVYLDRECVTFGSSTLSLRNWMRRNGVARAEGACDPDDHIGLELQLASWLARNRPDLLADYLQNHLLTWAFRYFEKLREADGEGFYGQVAHIASATLHGIAEALEIAPVPARIHC